LISLSNLWKFPPFLFPNDLAVLELALTSTRKRLDHYSRVLIQKLQSSRVLNNDGSPGQVCNNRVVWDVRQNVSDNMSADKMSARQNVSEQNVSKNVSD
jgi:hypothetical protein